MNVRITHALVAALAAVSLATAVCAQPTAATQAESHTITVSGTAHVNVAPNTCNFNVAVTARGNSAPAAQKAMSEPLDAVIARLKELGVADEDIQTTYTDVSPVWDENGATDTYEARTVMQISNVDIDQVGTLMSAASDAGATEVTGLEYLTTAYDDAYKEALAKAVEASRPKAETIAEASGLVLGEVCSVTEGYQNTAYYAEEKAMAADGAAEADALTIEPGEVEITAEVTVSYTVR